MSSGRTHGGKGSKTRPTDAKKYADSYDAIFGKKKEKASIAFDSLLKTPDQILEKDNDSKN
tara:strand:- start:1129 stop:1311 length:183 start_codon:yes stop_codon:yes gene_type:complete